VPVVDRAAEPDIWDFIGTTTTNASAAAAAPAPVLEDSPRQKLYKQTNADFNRKLRQVCLSAFSSVNDLCRHLRTSLCGCALSTFKTLATCQMSHGG